MHIALYARKSTEQEDRQVQSLADQLSELKRLAERENLTITEVFQESRSAKAPGTRPEFERMMKAVESDEIEGILTWSMSRLARNPVDGGRVAYALQTGRLQVIRTFERTYTPDDNALLLSIENGMATAYLQDLSRNVKRGMRGRIDRGWACYKAPLGYKNDAESREIVPDPDRFPIMRSAWEMLLNGHTVAEVWIELTRLGLTVPSRRGSPMPISKGGIYHIFKNPFYMGLIKHRTELLPGKHQAMVSPEEFRKVQRRLSKNHEVKTPMRGRMPFAGVFTCAVCGCAVIGERKHKHYVQTNRSVTYTYYHCSGSKGCPKISISEEALTGALEGLMEKFRNVPGFVAEQVRQICERAFVQRQQTEGDVVTIQSNRLASLQQRRERLVAMRLDGELSADEFSRHRTVIEDQIKECSETIQRAGSLADQMESAASRFIAIAIEAGELSGQPGDPLAMGRIARELGQHHLNLGEPVFIIDPFLAKIASLEPADLRSESQDAGGKEVENQIWCAIGEDLISLLDLGH